MEQDAVAGSHLRRLAMGRRTGAESKLVKVTADRSVVRHRGRRVGDPEGLQPVLGHAGTV